MELNKRLTKIEGRTGKRETVVVFWNAEVGYYRIPPGKIIDYRVVATGLGAVPVSEDELKELERRRQVLFVRWGGEND